MQRGLVGSEMCIRDRYQRRVHGRSILDGNETLVSLEAKALELGEPKRVSGRQEMLENILINAIQNRIGEASVGVPFPFSCGRVQWVLCIQVLIPGRRQPKAWCWTGTAGKFFLRPQPPTTCWKTITACASRNRGGGLRHAEVC
eukprot:TRINITY_DN11721_c0_g1_i2.p4 TRINITY_DN11721_c0_g1~~TRINITY_DN11721_c0_g1_i2.p4  ORF type:complete len:144 (-),score=31.69 TRINITY_DN11721_c0_g1_i2:299-730(-)